MTPPTVFPKMHVQFDEPIRVGHRQLPELADSLSRSLHEFHFLRVKSVPTSDPLKVVLKDFEAFPDHVFSELDGVGDGFP